jgi:hypothetical protein
MPETFTVDRVDRLTDVLYGVAAAGGLIGYVPLGYRVGLATNHMSWHLGQVSRRSVAEGGPMWTALCVSARTRRPQDQFHKLARELRPEYAALDDEEVWRQERDRCYDAAASARRMTPPSGG